MSVDKEDTFYHSTIKRLVTVFGSIFSNIHYYDDFDKKHKVTLFYSAREKFLVDRGELNDLYRLGTNHPYPRMGFELMGMNYASERMTNPINKLRGQNDAIWSYNRVPYDFSFNLYIATKQFEQSLKIVEQILPMFSPSFNVTINELIGFKNLKNDIGVVLNSVSNDIDYQGSVYEDRTITWTLNFTLKAYLYNRIQVQEVIKETITNMSTSEMDSQYITLISVVEPRNANKDDPHTIIDKREDHTND